MRIVFKTLSIALMILGFLMSLYVTYQMASNNQLAIYNAAILFYAEETFISLLAIVLGFIGGTLTWDKADD